MAVIKHTSKGYIVKAGNSPEYTSDRSKATEFAPRGAKIQCSKLNNAGNTGHTVVEN